MQDLFDRYSDNLANGREGGDLSRCRCQAIYGCYTGGENDCEQFCDPATSCNPQTQECTVGRESDGAGLLLLMLLPTRSCGGPILLNSPVLATGFSRIAVY